MTEVEPALIRSIRAFTQSPRLRELAYLISASAVARYGGRQANPKSDYFASESFSREPRTGGTG
jgi:hypothetical protein